MGLRSASDPVVLAAAVEDDRVLIALDTDFGALIAHSGSRVPGVILFRGNVTRRPDAQAELLLANLDQFAEDVDSGAIVVIGEDQVRVRRLPIDSP